MDGVLIINKPQGMTSHDVVDLIRRRFHLKKVGHAGTLDPMATGVLVTLVGTYTKLSNQFMSEEKEYEGSLVLGASSDTCDAWGKVTPSGRPGNFTGDEIKAAFEKFLGSTEQTPPLYSAVKVGGRKLYELARKGLSVEVPARKILIKNIEVLKVDLPEVSFRLTCSKGTYVRTLCADIGKCLGCGAYMSRLVRTRSGRFTIGQALPLEELRNMTKDALEKAVIKQHESN
ncbi:MAG: tRNA pseudouridine(55) synthase TruB [Candidatus Omnitrophica bacterium]|nr:tRNA pseudouridine(55) synthase TruB [Candidatus Omnitrophota bacterium]MDD5436895.1 tRNA pseudouridine(55) synthase TruB [Candidatus Omnitrophota bacterium]